jgi:hypothetical protein
MKPRHAWIAFAACLVVAAAGLAALTHRALEADRAEAAARHEAAVEENVRLALWRIDSALAALVARETANVRGTQVVPPVVETFVVDAAGRRRTLAAAADGDTVPLDAASLLARLPEPQAPAAVMPELDAEQVADLPVQQARNFSELQARRQTLQQNNLAQQQVLELAAPAATPLAPLTAAWAGEALVLARRVPPQAGGPTISCRRRGSSRRRTGQRPPISGSWPRSPPGSSPARCRRASRPAGRLYASRWPRPGWRWPSPPVPSAGSSRASSP